MQSPQHDGVWVGRVGWFVLLTGFFVLPAGTLRSQQQPPINVEVKVVNVFAAVRDKHGQIVNSLGRENFELQEDGHPQTISYFTRETDLPLTFGLLVDTSLSQRHILNRERSASHSFLDNLLREDKDKAFVIHFDREVELLQDPTASRHKLDGALDLVGTPQLVRDGDGGDRDSRSRSHGGGTLLYDAIYLASDEVINKQQGRKALIVFSDGVDRGSKETLVDAIMTAQRADTAVYSILSADEEENQHSLGGIGGPGMGRHGGGRGYPHEERPDGKKILERISKETGGRMFEVSKKQSVDQICASIEEEFRNQYSLGYTPAANITPGYHKIHLATKQKDMTVQTRDGYYWDR